MRFAVTFDDGYLDNFTIAAPILKKLGVPATFFVVTEKVGAQAPYWWDKAAQILRLTNRQSINWRDVFDGAPLRLQPLARRRQKQAAYDYFTRTLKCDPAHSEDDAVERLRRAADVAPDQLAMRLPLMGWREIRQLADDGFDIGAHSATHKNLATENKEIHKAEILDSTRELAVRLNKPVTSFAYPYGKKNNLPADCEELFKQAGIRHAFTGEAGVARPDTNPFRIPRISLNRSNRFVWSYNIDQAFRETHNE